MIAVMESSLHNLQVRKLEFQRSARGHKVAELELELLYPDSQSTRAKHVSCVQALCWLLKKHKK